MARSLFWRLIWLYLLGSMAAVVVTLSLVFIGLQLTAQQWVALLIATPVAVAMYISLDIYAIHRHYKPLNAALSILDAGEELGKDIASPALVTALNLPYYSFVRVTFLHGPAATVSIVIVLVFANLYFGVGYETWQILVFAATVLAFASPTHAIFEYFAISRLMVPTIRQLWSQIDKLEEEYRKELISINLFRKLLFLSIFVTAVPLIYLSASIIFKVDLLFTDLNVETTFTQMLPLWQWIVGVALVCMLGALVMSVLTATEVSRSASMLNNAMTEVEEGNLDNQLYVIGTDEYADLFRGYNLMTESLRQEVEILEVTQDLAGELKLDALLERIMRATTNLLKAERSTLFLHDQKENILWSVFAEGLEIREIRMPDDQGIAGKVYQTGEPEMTDDPYNHPLFNPAIDKQTGYETESILCVPIVNKAGERIGVTQVLNKQDGMFTSKDQTRLRAFAAQIAVAIENARLFDDVLNMKNYNESVLQSTSNGMITLNKEREVVTANQAALSILETDEAKIVDQPVAALFDSKESWVLDSISKVERTGDSDITLDADIKLANGNAASVNLTAVPLIDANEQDIGSMLILEDISSEKRVRSTMARYMNKEVADQLLEAGEDALGGKIQHISVLFSDVRDFTNLSERLGARETVSMLNEYFTEMVEVILENQGILDKYIGDAMMALFGAPFQGNQDAANAVSVANQMIVSLRGLNAKRVAAGNNPIDIGIGISTGDVIVGNIGSPKRLEYTAIGDSVNLASRLEGANKYYGTKVLISENTLQELNGQFLLREIDLMRVKGKDLPVSVYEPLDYHSEETFPHRDDVLQSYKAGLSHYRAREWEDAITCFKAALDKNEHDRPSKIYLDRCNIYMASPPEEDWDGVWVLTEK